MSANKRNPRTRPVFKLSAIDDQEKFKPVPAPVGEYPFRLDIKKISPHISGEKFTFHIVGDTGGINSTHFQQDVIKEMIAQYGESRSENEEPQFLFHVGDIVYNFGQASEYYNQFFNPYRNYPRPIFAIAGNHDADISLLEQNPPKSLDAFMSVFCDSESRPLALARDTGRLSNIQPNIYWVLETPLADIICLYSNVPKFGNIQQEQRKWFVEALKTSAAKQKAIVVCVHHAPYSADVNHGSSIHMMALLDGSFREADVFPDIVFSGHVHNYQRFSKNYPGSKIIPYIVSGAGGYADLHKLAAPGEYDFPDDSCLLDNVELENYCDDAHGFLKIELEKNQGKIIIKGEYYITGEVSTLLHDSFRVDVER